MKKKINILILGSNGQLGQEISRILSINKKINLHRSHTKKIKLLNIENFLEKIKKLDIKIIINCSAYTEVENSEKNKYLSKELNCNKVSSLAIFCKNYNIILVHFSTDYVFKGNKRIYMEKDKPYPINFYGKTKYWGEKNIINSGCKYFIFRISWLISKSKKSFISKIIKKIKSKKKIYVINDNYGNPTSVYFISKFINMNILNFLSKKKGIYNLVNKGRASWFDIANKVNFLLKKPDVKIKKISHKNFLSNVKRPINSCLSMKKTNKVFIVNNVHWEYELKKIMR